MEMGMESDKRKYPHCSVVSIAYGIEEKGRSTNNPHHKLDTIKVAPFMCTWLFMLSVSKFITSW